MKHLPKPAIGEGIYDVASSAKYLLAGRMAHEIYPVTSRHLIRWIRTGLALQSLASVHGRDLLLTFEDLISMRVIAALRAAGVSWSSIRLAEKWLRDSTGHPRPFATEALWTDRNNVYARFKDKLIEASRHGQIAMDILSEYLIPISGLRFSAGLVSLWQPVAGVVLDPAVQFGAPCIEGTRIPTSAVWGMLLAGDSRELVMRAYEISSDQLAAAVQWEESLAAAA